MKKILVVDDDEKIRIFVEELLVRMGYKVLLATDGQEALQILRAEKPLLIVLDLAMPRMHGFEVCRKIRADSSPEIASIKIIVVSAKNYPVDMKMATEVGADVYLVKPFGLQELRDAVSKLLGNTP
jgi:two-component system, OmpR family, alkaline phosphatase synthesis response regulator PhoP